MPQVIPYIPQRITVHLGAPSSNAANVTVNFVDYVKNVASSEIYPTWEEAALRANILAIVSFALNRVYTEFYRSRGYNFDITNSTAYDQFFVNGRSYFTNVARLVDELFDDYLRRPGFVEPLAAKFCNGTTVTCEGLSQWGSQNLARQGYDTVRILRSYYGNVEIVNNAPIRGITSSYPGTPLRRGTTGPSVVVVQVELNRISQNYPAIPKIVVTDGLFSTDTEEAVKEFQHIAGLTPDGIVGNATWYAILFYYNAVKRLNELNSEGLSLSEISQEFPFLLQEGMTGQAVRNLQYYISYLSRYYQTIPSVAVDGIFGPATKAAVIDVQNTFDLTPDGIVGPYTWQRIYNAYLGIARTIPIEYVAGRGIPYQGVPLRLGSEGETVLLLQRYLNRIAQSINELPEVTPTGYFGNITEQVVRSFQDFYGLPVTGVVNIETWDAIESVFDDVSAEDTLRDGQYPGYPVS